MATKFKVYAIRMGDCVELRIASTPPLAKISKLTKTTTSMEVRYVPIPQNPFVKRVNTPVTHKTTLKQVFYVGGRVLGICKYSTFQIVSKPFALLLEYRTLTKDKMVAIPRELKDVLLRGCL